MSISKQAGSNDPIVLSFRYFEKSRGIYNESPGGIFAGAFLKTEKNSRTY